MRPSILVPLALVVSVFVGETVATQKLYELTMSKNLEGANEGIAYIKPSGTLAKSLFEIRRTAGTESVIYSTKRSGTRSLTFESNAKSFKVAETVEIDGKSNLVNENINVEGHRYLFSWKNMQYECFIYLSDEVQCESRDVQNRFIATLYEAEGTWTRFFRTNTKYMIMTDPANFNAETEAETDFIIQVAAVIKMRQIFDPITTALLAGDERKSFLSKDPAETENPKTKSGIKMPNIFSHLWNFKNAERASN